MTMWALACFALAAFLALWAFMVWRGLAQDWLPPELKAARLVAVEEDLATDSPYPVVGRPDQVYRIATGEHVPVELKNRDCETVYVTDVAEVSLRAWLLRRNGWATTGHGYLVINNRRTGKRTAIRVNLRDDAFCERLIQRHIDVVEGVVPPRRSKGRKCDSCGHRAKCYP